MEFVQKFTPPDFKVKNFTPSISPYFNSFSGKKHKKWVKMEKFTPLAKILHCRRHWRHGQIPPLIIIRVFIMIVNDHHHQGVHYDCISQVRTGGRSSERLPLPESEWACNTDGDDNHDYFDNDVDHHLISLKYWSSYFSYSLIIVFIDELTLDDDQSSWS